MRRLDLALCGLLAIGGVGHFAGTLAFYEAGTEIFVWSLSASAFVFTLVALHLLRINRRDDRPLALIALIGSLAWAGLALAFGHAADGILDPRVLLHAFAALGLSATTLAGLRRGSAVTT